MNEFLKAKGERLFLFLLVPIVVVACVLFYHKLYLPWLDPGKVSVSMSQGRLYSCSCIVAVAISVAFRRILLIR